MSNYFKDTCIAIEPGTISWLNPWAFFPLLLSTVGIILTLEVGYGLWIKILSKLGNKRWQTVLFEVSIIYR